MRFIHTADLHIDQPFSGINSDHADIKEVLKNANKKVLSNIVDLCIEKQVDFLLIVGDTFHRNQPSIHTQKLVMDQFERLAKHDIKVVMSFGNHDYYTANRYWFEWPENVILFKKEEVETKTIQLKNGESVSISGFSYEHLWIEESMLPSFPKKQMESTYHIGFYHGDNSERYAPFLVSDLPLNYDYWALGHIHKSEIMSERPFAAYPGTPQGHTKKETQVKGVLYVELNHSSREVEWIDVSSIQWKPEVLVIEEDLLKQDLLKRIETFVLAKTYECDFNIISILIKTTTENAIKITDEKEEMLLYLQELLYKNSNKKIWLKELSLYQNQSEKLIMGFETSLIDDLGRKYQSKENFEKVVNDLIKQPGIANNLIWEQDDILELVTESSQLIKDKMIFKDEEK